MSNYRIRITTNSNGDFCVEYRPVGWRSWIIGPWWRTSYMHSSYGSMDSAAHWAEVLYKELHQKWRVVKECEYD